MAEFTLSAPGYLVLLKLPDGAEHHFGGPDYSIRAKSYAHAAELALRETEHTAGHVWVYMRYTSLNSMKERDFPLRSLNRELEKVEREIQEGLYHPKNFEGTPEELER